MDDNILRMYIDEVFGMYDQDRSGYLDKRQLVGFFNQLFASFNDPRRIDQNTINQLLTSCDMNHDGKVNKPQLFTLFKRILTGDTSMISDLPRQQQNWGNQQNYGGNNSYNQYQGPNQYPGNQYPQQQQNQWQKPNNPYQNQPYNSNPYQNQQQSSWGNNRPPQNQSNWGNNQGPRYY